MQSPIRVTETPRPSLGLSRLAKALVMLASQQRAKQETERDRRAAS